MPKTTFDISAILQALIIAAIVAGVGVWGQHLVTKNKVDRLQIDIKDVNNKLDSWYHEHQILKFHTHDGNGKIEYPRAMPLPSYGRVLRDE